MAEEREIRCKSFQGHRWDDPPTPPRFQRKPKPGFVRVYMRCIRCGNEKLVTINRLTGETRSQYFYQDTYKSAAGVTKRDWNREWLRRINSRKKAS